MNFTSSALSGDSGVISLISTTVELDGHILSSGPGIDFSSTFGSSFRKNFFPVLSLLFQVQGSLRRTFITFPDDSPSATLRTFDKCVPTTAKNSLLDTLIQVLLFSSSSGSVLAILSGLLRIHFVSLSLTRRHHSDACENRGRKKIELDAFYNVLTFV